MDTPTVLLLQYDRALREVCRRVLIQGGYDVVAPPPGKLGLDDLWRTDDHFTAIVADTNASATRLSALIGLASLRRPPLPVLVLTAGRAADVAVPSAIETTVRVLEKPFDATKLRTALKELIDAHACRGVQEKRAL